jgi:hypothetical protein
MMAPRKYSIISANLERREDKNQAGVIIKPAPRQSKHIHASRHPLGNRGDFSLLKSELRHFTGFPG